MRRFSTGNGIFSTPVIDANGIIYVGSADKNFYALDPKSGSEQWRIETDEIIDSAACIGPDGNVYFAGGDAALHAVDEEGAPLWKFDVLHDRDPKLFSLSTNYWWEANVVMGPDGALYAGNDDFYFYCIEPDGKMRWAFRTGILIWAAASFSDDGAVYVPGFDMNLYAIESKTGRLIWKKNLGNPLVSSAAVAEDGTIFQGGFDGILHALDGSSGRIKWSLETGGHIYSSAAVGEDGKVYIASTDGFMYAADQKTGKLLWTYYTGDAIRSSPSLGPDPEGKVPYLIYFGGGDGRVFALDPEGSRRWSYDTAALAGETDYPNINASPALGDGGLAVAQSNGEVTWIPYDYYLAPDAAGIDRDPGDGFQTDGASWHYVTPGGMISRTPVANTPAVEVHPTHVITLRATVSHGRRIVPATLDLSTLRVETSPAFPHRIEPQSDGMTVNIIPDKMLEPGAEYIIRAGAEYSASKGIKGTVEGEIAIAIVPGVAMDTSSAKKDSAFRISHMSIPQPAIVPSLDQIGIASLSIEVVVVRFNQSDGSFVAWGVQKFGLGEFGESVGIPKQRSLIYAFEGLSRGDSFTMEAKNCFFEITAFPVPLDSLHFSGRFGSIGEVEKGACLVAEYKIPGLKNSLSNILDGRWKGFLKGLSWIAGQLNDGRGKFIEAAKVTGPMFIDMARGRVWRKWGLFNLSGKFVGIGTFKTSPISPRKSVGIKILDIKLSNLRGSIVADYEVDDSVDLTNMVIGILLIDKSSGAPLPIDYNSISHRNLGGNKKRTTLSIPVSTRIKPGKVTAVFMADLAPIKEVSLR